MRNKEKVSRLKINKILKLYKNETKIPNIEDQTGLSKWIIVRVLKENKVFNPSQDRIAIGKILGKELVENYQNGKTLNELVKIYKFSRQTITDYLKKKKIWDNKRDIFKIEIPHQKKEIVKKKYLLKKKIKEISLEEKIPEHRIRKFLKEIKIFDRQRDSIIKGKKRGSNPKVSETRLSKEWDFNKNKLGPEYFTTGSDKKVFWICNKCKLSYEAVIHNRFFAKTKCSYCAGMKASKFNNLKVLYPSVAKTFHLVKNNTSPELIVAGSHKKYWWICENKKHHIYQATVYDRTQKKYKKKGSGFTLGTNCPFCSGRQVWPGESFGDYYPHLIKELDHKQDENFNIFKISIGSDRRANWVCYRGHKWRAGLNHRARGTGCPRCKKPYTKEQLRIFAEISYIFNDAVMEYERLDVYSKQFKLAFEYDGDYWHKNKLKKDIAKNAFWRKRGVKIIRFRENLKKLEPNDVEFTKKVGYPLEKKIINQALENVRKLFYKDKIIKSLINKYIKRKDFVNDKKYKFLLNRLPFPMFNKTFAAKKPKLSKFWNYEKNYPLKPDEVSAFLPEVIYFKCDKGHEFKRRLNHISGKKFKGCPICSGKVIIKENSFAAKYPKLVNLLERKKNKKDILFKIGPTSAKMIWWKCLKNKDHSHYRRAVNKAKNPSCPYCNKRLVEKNKTFRILYPDLVKYWDYSYNKTKKYSPFKNLTPDNVNLGSHISVGFICPDCKKKHHYILREILRKYPRQKIKSIYCEKCNNPYGTKIKCINTNEVFNTVSEASKKFKISGTSIHNNIDKKSKYANLKTKLAFIRL